MLRNVRTGESFPSEEYALMMLHADTALTPSAAAHLPEMLYSFMNS